MDGIFSQDEIDYANRVHIVMQGQGVFPEGHIWAGFTRVESEMYAAEGRTPEEARDIPAIQGEVVSADARAVPTTPQSAEPRAGKRVSNTAPLTAPTPSSTNEG